MKNKLAIFDLDGTLFNTNMVNYKAYKEALNEFNYDIDFDYFANFCNGKHYKEFLPKIVDNKEIILLIHERKKELYQNYLNNACINTHLFNIIEMIKKEYFIALVTTASKKNTYSILEYFDKTKLFDLILTNDEIKEVKPNPEGFNKAISYFKIKNSDTIIFEDSIEGISAARQSGASVYVVDKF